MEALPDIQLSLSDLEDWEKAAAAHARYQFVRHLLFDLYHAKGVVLPDALKKRVWDIVSLQSHDHNPSSAKIQYWMNDSEKWRGMYCATADELKKANARIAELEKK